MSAHEHHIGRLAAVPNTGSAIDMLARMRADAEALANAPTSSLRDRIEAYQLILKLNEQEAHVSGSGLRAVDEEYVSFRRAREILGTEASPMSGTTLRRYVRQGQIASHVWGRKIHFRLADLAAFKSTSATAKIA